MLLRISKNKWFLDTGNMCLQSDVCRRTQLELLVLVPVGEQDQEAGEQHEQEQDEHPPDAPRCCRPYGHCVSASPRDCLERICIMVGR